MSKQKIQFVMSYHNNMYDLIRELQKKADVEVLSFRPIAKDTYITKGIRITPIRHYAIPGTSMAINSPLGLIRHITPQTQHVILKHVHLLRNILPALVAHRRGAHVTVIVQQPPRKDFISHLITKGMLWLMRSLHASVVAVTRDGYRAYRGTVSNIAYIPACINVTRFPQKQYHRDTNVLKILCIAKYQKRKNIALLLQAVSQLKKQYPRISFHLTVVGTVADPDEYTNIQHLKRSLNLDREVTLRREVPHHNMPKLLQMSDILILPSSSEPLGYSVLEAMAAGLPVIATVEAGAHSYISHGTNGFVIPPGDIHSLIDSLSSFMTNEGLADTQKLEQFGTASRKRAVTNHSPQSFVQSLYKLIP